MTGTQESDASLTIATLGEDQRVRCKRLQELLPIAAVKLEVDIVTGAQIGMN